MRRPEIYIATLLLFAAPAFADRSAFHAGDLITDFGRIAEVETNYPIPGDARFRISFDVSKQAEAGELNRNFESAARFLNMHAAAGIDPKQIEITIVVHGGASKELLSADAYAVRFDANSANVALIETLLDHNVQFVLCGQSAAYHDVANADLVPGVRTALSAMTAHALLQQQGFTLNPF